MCIDIDFKIPFTLALRDKKLNEKNIHTEQLHFFPNTSLTTFVNLINRSSDWERERGRVKYFNSIHNSHSSSEKLNFYFPDLFTLLCCQWNLFFFVQFNLFTLITAPPPTRSLKKLTSKLYISHVHFVAWNQMKSFKSDLYLDTQSRNATYL